MQKYQEYMRFDMPYSLYDSSGGGAYSVQILVRGGGLIGEGGLIVRRV